MDALKSPGKHSKRTQGYPLREPADIEREAGREQDRREEQRELKGPAVERVQEHERDEDRKSS
jgi:hypothetical protein